MDTRRIDVRGFHLRPGWSKSANPLRCFAGIAVWAAPNFWLLKGIPAWVWRIGDDVLGTQVR